MKHKYAVSLIVEIEDYDYNWTSGMVEGYLKDILDEYLEDPDKVLDIEVEELHETVKS